MIRVVLLIGASLLGQFLCVCEPQLDLPPIPSTAPAELPPVTPTATAAVPSPITIDDKNVDLVQPNSYAGENFSEEEQHPIGEYESDRSNRYGPPYDDEADYYNNKNPWVSEGGIKG